MPHLVVMGVSGSGKSTVARLLAERLGWPFAEGDDFHPPANVTKMARGVALEDTDRLPWLTEIADWIAGQERQSADTVVACSALRRRYRDILRSAAADVRFVHLHGSAAVLQRRMRERGKGHFMPPELLHSQLAALEGLEKGEDGCTLDVVHSPDRLVDEILSRLKRRPSR